MGKLADINFLKKTHACPHYAAAGRYAFIAFSLAACLMAHAAAPVKQAPPPLESKPSRYIGEKIGEFVADMGQNLAMRSRTNGPFGEPQDPDAKPAPLLSERTTSTKTPEPSVSLMQVVQMLEITTIMPKEKRFLIGSRSISQGEELPIKLKGKEQRIQIIQVSSEKIVFHNPKTGETAVRQLNVLPPGMSHGTPETPVPGMQPASDNAPIDLDPSSP